MTIQQAKEMDMVDYLSALGHEPAKISGKSYWYLSPLHEEKTASFKVNRHLNRWFDFAEGKGGNLVDFGVQFFNVSVSDFLKKLQVPDVSILHQSNTIEKQISDSQENHQIKILSVHDINAYPLLRYLQSRRISNDI